jgi:hypothetical protein
MNGIYYGKTTTGGDVLLIDYIYKTVNNYFCVDCMTKTRVQHTMRARQIAMYLTILKTDLTSTYIAKFYNYGHDTVLYSSTKIKDLMLYDKGIRQDVTNILYTLEKYTFKNFEDYEKFMLLKDIHKRLNNLTIDELIEKALTL